ncbi:aminoglycoside phosphotransferase family protein [Nocardioides aestuarii]|uniref:Aminoglycoside phosphotransferase family protein n=1 Tax=Nocardioides aestuarii TaxID=252231 RepID=A0ABW4TRF6_9ACTN
MTTPDIPAEVRAFAERGPAWAVFVDRLPRRLDGLLDEWSLRLDGEPMHGYCSLVVPVVAEDGTEAVLKVSFDGDTESEHEALALQHWHGRGAVRLLRADPRRRALLLERLHTTDLSDLWDLEACEVVAGLWASLHVPALPQLRSVGSYVERWVAALAGLPVNGPVPRRLVEQATSLAGDLLAEPDAAAHVVHGDLHYGNVLAADRAAWLAIDPKPMNGDRHYEVAPMLHNRLDELAGDVREGLRRRFHTLVDAGGLDEDRARAWVVVREVLNAHWGAQDEDRDAVTVALTIAKAVQD